MKKRIIIGGEKVFPLSILCSTNKNDIFGEYEREFSNSFYTNYTLGGYNSLLAIIDDLHLKHNGGTILLPSYICDSILIPFKDKDVKFTFYEVDGQLNPNFQNISLKLNKNVKAILFIDYIGKSQKENIFPFQGMFINQGIKIIQDCVQSIHMRSDSIYGDYAFNSFRKILPFEGSIIISKKPLQIRYTKGSNIRFILYKRIGQILRYFHLKYNLFRPAIFLNLFKKAELSYYNNKIYKLPRINKILIRKIDLRKIIENQKRYYEILLNKYHDFTLKSLHRIDFQPFGFFMIIPERDKVRVNLSNNNIYCPIHWKLSKKINRLDYQESWEISEKSVTIPLDNLDETKLNHLLFNLDKSLKI